MVLFDLICVSASLGGHVVVLPLFLGHLNGLAMFVVLTAHAVLLLIGF